MLGRAARFFRNEQVTSSLTSLANTATQAALQSYRRRQLHNNNVMRQSTASPSVPTTTFQIRK